MNEITPNLSGIKFYRALAESKRLRREKKGKPFDCYVVKVELSEFLETVSKYSAEAAALRIQIVLKDHFLGQKNWFHYSALELEVSKEGKKAFLIDSVGNQDYPRQVEHLNKNGFEEVFAIDCEKNYPQHTSVLCDVFAFDFATQNSKRPNLFKELLVTRIQDGISYVSWQSLHPSYLKFFQKRSFFKDFPEAHALAYKNSTLKEEMESFYVGTKNKGVEKKKKRYELLLANLPLSESLLTKDPSELFKERHLK